MFFDPKFFIFVYETYFDNIKLKEIIISGKSEVTGMEEDGRNGPQDANYESVLLIHL